MIEHQRKMKIEKALADFVDAYAATQKHMEARNATHTEMSRHDPMRSAIGQLATVLAKVD